MYNCQCLALFRTKKHKSTVLYLMLFGAICDVIVCDQILKIWQQKWTHFHLSYQADKHRMIGQMEVIVKC